MAPWSAARAARWRAALRPYRNCSPLAGSRPGGACLGRARTRARPRCLAWMAPTAMRTGTGDRPGRWTDSAYRAKTIVASSLRLFRGQRCPSGSATSTARMRLTISSGPAVSSTLSKPCQSGRLKSSTIRAAPSVRTAERRSPSRAILPVTAWVTTFRIGCGYPVSAGLVACGKFGLFHLQQRGLFLWGSDRVLVGALSFVSSGCVDAVVGNDLKSVSGVEHDYDIPEDHVLQ